MITLPEMRKLAQTAADAVDAYEHNSDPSKEEVLLFAMETAEQSLVDAAVYSKAVVKLFGALDEALALADKAAGNLYKGQPYEIGKAKRDVSSEVARGIRSMLQS